MRFTSATLLALLVASFSHLETIAFVPNRNTFSTTTRSFQVSRLDEQETIETLDDDSDKDITENPLYPRSKIPNRLRIAGKGIPGRNDKIQLVDTSTYEAALIERWEQNPDRQKGFDWEIEKARRYFAGLRMRDDGTWVKQPSFFEFLVSKHRINSGAVNGPSPVNLLDVFVLFSVNLLASIGFGPALGMAAVPNAVIQKYEGSFFSFIKGVLGGDLQTLAGGPLFLLLNKYFLEYGPIFNLAFGPKAFLVISDPVMSRHILRTATTDQYCKGMLAEILEPIMGKGLIPADPATWRVRRRAIVPGFHKKWLNRMVTLFNERAEILSNDLKMKEGKVVDMEERFCSVTLDIIGKAVFNYDFGSVTNESPIVKAVYRVLREAEHRSSSFIPYWNLPYADQWMGGQVEFRRDMTMLDDILADLINEAVSTRREASVEELEERDNADDPSLLRFLVDMRGEDLSSMTLRDDLMTMLIAGHETTAAMLTWTLFELARGDPGLFREVQHEVRTVLKGKDQPDYHDLISMKKLRYSLIEGLRLYPEPPLLIRRARTEDTLPQGSSKMGEGIKVLRGTDIFISTWNLHRSPDLWENPEKFDPTRWDRPFKNPSVKGWEGYDPDKVTGLYPNEVATDFAFLPFGGGQRKCVGDQFAVMEAAVTLSVLLKNFDFIFEGSPDDVGMKTGATIHTMNGLKMRPKVVSDDDEIPPSDGWWEKQHLKRGLSASGRPVQSKEDVATQNLPKKPRPDDPGMSACPMH
ncbi:cytochrome P450 [Nitzschia inconspicua]|uniref:Cytochrome P450 n=1 Tax=Nitzschia inconspicua TaxID=303405 RepID=A0A9K3L2C4_9STRA|nr:cytochrome P450 [Nitzschia inconspicua]